HPHRIIKCLFHSLISTCSLLHSCLIAGASSFPLTHCSTHISSCCRSLIASVLSHQPSREPRLFNSLAQLIFFTRSLIVLCDKITQVLHHQYYAIKCEVSGGASLHQPTPSFPLQHVHVTSSSVFSTRSFPLTHCSTHVLLQKSCRISLVTGASSF